MPGLPRFLNFQPTTGMGGPQPMIPSAALPTPSQAQFTFGLPYGYSEPEAGSGELMPGIRPVAPHQDQALAQYQPFAALPDRIAYDFSRVPQRNGGVSGPYGDNETSATGPGEGNPNSGINRARMAAEILSALERESLDGMDGYKTRESSRQEALRSMAAEGLTYKPPKGWARVWDALRTGLTSMGQGGGLIPGLISGATGENYRQRYQNEVNMREGQVLRGREEEAQAANDFLRRRIALGEIASKRAEALRDISSAIGTPQKNYGYQGVSGGIARTDAEGNIEFFKPPWAGEIGTKEARAQADRELGFGVPIDDSHISVYPNLAPYKGKTVAELPGQIARADLYARSRNTGGRVGQDPKVTEAQFNSALEQRIVAESRKGDNPRLGAELVLQHQWEPMRDMEQDLKGSGIHDMVGLPFSPENAPAIFEKLLQIRQQLNQQIDQHNNLPTGDFSRGREVINPNAPRFDVDAQNAKIQKIDEVIKTYRQKLLDAKKTAEGIRYNALRLQVEPEVREQFQNVNTSAPGGQTGDDDFSGISGWGN